MLNKPAGGLRLGNMLSIFDAVMNMNGANAKGALTAAADGLQADATQLVNGLNSIDTVAGAADSCQLPAAIAGTVVLVGNSTATASQIFGKNGRTDTINATAGATGVSLAGHANALFFCAVTGKWRMILTA